MNTSSQEKSQQHQGYGTLLLLALCLLLVACGSAPVQPTASAHGASCPSTGKLQGAGSTFDAPLFAQMFTAYEQNPCGLAVTYLGGGSAAGMNALLDQNVDFAATDVPLTDAAEARSTHGSILHIPITLGTEAIIYQVPGVPSLLKLTGPVLADIFLGKITTWNDPAITALNPGLALPGLPMTVIHRSDGSGTTGIFTHYLSLISPTWKSAVGASVFVNWPVGIGERGNGGVADAVESMEGSIGYVELSYALRLHLPYALLPNAAGQYVAPSIQGALAAALSAPNPPADLRFYLVNEPGADVYPIAGYSWVIVYQHQEDANKGRALATLFWWMLHDGQRYAEPLHYAALPASMVSRSEAQIRAMTCGTNHAPCSTG